MVTNRSDVRLNFDSKDSAFRKRVCRNRRHRFRKLNSLQALSACECVFAERHVIFGKIEDTAFNSFCCREVQQVAFNVEQRANESFVGFNEVSVRLIPRVVAINREFHYVLTVCKRTCANARKRCRNVHRRKLIAVERHLTNRRQTVRKSDRRKSRVFKRIFVNLRYRSGQREVYKAYAILEGVLRNNVKRAERYGMQGRTTLKRIAVIIRIRCITGVVNSVYLRHINNFKRRTTSEHIRVQRRSFREVRFFQSRTTRERVIVDTLNACATRYRFKRGTITKRVRTNGRQRVGQMNALKALTILERARLICITNARYAFGNNNFRQCRTTTKRAITNTRYLGRNGKALKRSTAHKRLIRNRRKFCRQLNRFKRRTRGEYTST